MSQENRKEAVEIKGLIYEFSIQPGQQGEPRSLAWVGVKVDVRRWLI